ncbi:unnamed protein product [Dicrocoelium dendriticum]|nr:unnamed protein product [Dicrocoelium dendriticum]
MGRRHRRLRRQIPKQPHVGSHEMLATENNEEKNAADQLAEQSGQTFCSSSDLDTSHSHNFIDKPVFHGFHCVIPVFLPSTNRQLLASLLALDRGDSVVISGPVGCGKSAFINHLRSIVCTRLIRLQISEQTDAKVGLHLILGSLHTVLA